MTTHEKELIAALEADIKTWEQEIVFFDTLVNRIDFGGGIAMPGREYATGLRKRIKDWRELIERVQGS